jgi:hypothetical protein
MNSSAIGIEAGNNGVGETWTPVQQDTFVALCRVLCDSYGIPIDHVHAHFEWAPSRKIDPAGNSRYAAGGASWDMDAFRGDVHYYTGGAPPPVPEEDMTPEQAQQLAELHASLTGPISDRFVDPGGVPIDVPWGVGWTWEYVSQNVDTKLADIIARLDRLEQT